MLPGANGSARICFADGTEAIVGVKAEVDKTARPSTTAAAADSSSSTDDAGGHDWVEMTVDIPGHRDDEASTAFLAAMLGEALLATGRSCGGCASAAASLEAVPGHPTHLAAAVVPAAAAVADHAPGPAGHPAAAPEVRAR